MRDMCSQANSFPFLATAEQPAIAQPRSGFRSRAVLDPVVRLVRNDAQR